MKPYSRPSSCRGSAIMVVLWALVVLSAAVFAWARWIQQDIQLGGNAGRGMEARAMAHSGVAVAMNPVVTKQSSILKEDVANGQGYRVRIISEGGKLNLLWLLSSGGDPVRMGLFKQWLASHGMTMKECDQFIDCLLDYVDPDNVRRLNGVEDDGDYHPANRPLTSIDELQAVRGAGPLLRSAGWRDQLTMESSGPIDLLAAPPEILRLIPGLGEGRIQRLLLYRAGRDKLDGTADDPEVQGLPQLFSILGISAGEAQRLNGLVMVNDPIIRILAEGHSSKVVRQVEVVARKSGAYPQVLSWKE